MKIVQHGARCSVTIVCPEGEDSGIYTCFAYNDSGHGSCQAELTVEEGETVIPVKNHSLVRCENVSVMAEGVSLC